jgi:hypothetical protein
MHTKDTPQPPLPPKGYICAVSAFKCSQSISYCLTLFLTHVISSTLKVDVRCSSKTSVLTKPTQCHIPEDDILRSHRRENLKFHVVNYYFAEEDKRAFV